MRTINFTGTSGQVLKLLLTDEEYERGLARAQENPQDLVSDTLKTQAQELLEMDDPCDPNNFLENQE